MVSSSKKGGGSTSRVVKAGRRALALLTAAALTCGLAPTAWASEDDAAASSPKAGELVITTTELPPAKVGSPYVTTLETANKRSEALDWTVTKVGNLNINGFTEGRATLTGNFTADDIGLHPIVVTATEKDILNPVTASKNYTLNVYAQPPLQVSGTPNVDWTYIPEKDGAPNTLTIKADGVTMSGEATDDLTIGFPEDVTYTQFSGVDAKGFDLSIDVDTTVDASRTLLFTGSNVLTALYGTDDGTPLDVSLGGPQGSTASVAFTEGVSVAGNLDIDNLHVTTERNISADGQLNIIAGNVVARQMLTSGDSLAVSDSFAKAQRLEAADELSISDSEVAVEPPEAVRNPDLPDGIAAGANLYVNDSVVSVEAAGEALSDSFPVAAAIYAGGHATFSGATLVSAQCTDGTGGAWGIFAESDLHFNLSKDASVDAVARAGAGKAVARADAGKDVAYGMGTLGSFEFAKNNVIAEPVGGATVKIAGGGTAVGLNDVPALHATVAYAEPVKPKPDPKPLVPTDDGGRLAKTGDPVAPIATAVAAVAALGAAAAAVALLRRRAARR